MSTNQPATQPRYVGQPFILVAVLVAALPALLAYYLATDNPFQVMLWLVDAILVVLAILRPFWGLLFFIGLLYVRPEEMGPDLAGMHLTLIVSMATLVGTWFKLFLERSRVTRTPMNVMIIGFGVALVMSTLLMGGSTAGAIQVAAKLALLVLIVLNLVRDREQYQAYITTIIVFTGYLSVYAIYLYFSGGALSQHDSADVGGLVVRSRATGIFGDPNDLGTTVLAGLALTVMRVTQTRGVARFTYLSVILVGVVCLLQTNSRSAMLGFMVVVLVSFIVYSPRRGAALMLATVCLVGLVLASSGRMTDFNAEEASANERLDFWDNGISQLIMHPLFGVGYTRFPDVNHHRAAHNSFVLCFAELGFVGYFFWMGFIYYGFRVPRDAMESDGVDAAAKREIAGARIAAAGLLVGAFFLTRTYIPVTYLFVQLPLVALLAHARAPDKLVFTGKERAMDALRILGLSAGSIVGLKLLIYKIPH